MLRKSTVRIQTAEVSATSATATSEDLYIRLTSRLLALLSILFLFISCGGYDKEIKKAVKKIETGDYNTAVAILTEVVRQKPSEARAHYHLGVAYNKLGRYEEASKELEIVLSQKPKNVEARYELGKALCHLGRKLGGLKAFRDVLQKEPTEQQVREIMKLTGEIYHVTQLTRSKADCSSPAFSPDGKHIVYVSLAQGLIGKIYIMDPDGKNKKLLTPENYSDFTPSFSPDSKKIIFSSGVKREDEIVKRGIYTMDIDGQNRKLLIKNPLLRSKPIYSPDGSKIIYEVQSAVARQVVIADVDASVSPASRHQRNLFSQSESTNGWVNFSPDGKRIVFTTTIGRNLEIYSANIDGSNRIRLTENPAIDYMPAYSHDGTKIAFVSTRINENPEIYIMNSTGKKQQRLTNSKGEDVSPSFSPDDKKIVFASVRNSSYRQICIMNLGRGLTREELLASISKQISIYQ